MQISERKEGDVRVFEVEGQLDAVTSPEVENVVLARLDAGEHRLILDFTNVEYVSSAGLRLLILANNRAKKLGGRVALVGVNPRILHTLEITGFAAHFPIYANCAQALPTFE